MLNWKEIIVKGLPTKINELANYYRGTADGERKRPANLIDDVIFLATYFATRCVDFIRGAITALTGIMDSQPVMALRLQLSVALAVVLDFSNRVIQVLPV